MHREGADTGEIMTSSCSCSFSRAMTEGDVVREDSRGALDGRWVRRAEAQFASEAAVKSSAPGVGERGGRGFDGLPDQCGDLVRGHRRFVHDVHDLTVGLFALNQDAQCPDELFGARQDIQEFVVDEQDLSTNFDVSEEAGCDQ